MRWLLVLEDEAGPDRAFVIDFSAVLLTAIPVNESPAGG